MRRHNRTRRMIVTGYWIFSIVALTGVAAWQFEWIKFEGTLPSLLGSRGESQTDESRQNTAPQLPVDDIVGDPAVFTDQREPSIDGEAYQGAALIGRTSPVPPERLVPSGNWDGHGTSNMPGTFTTNTERRAADGQAAAPGTPPSKNNLNATRGGGNVGGLTAPTARRPLGSAQPEEWNGQGSVRQISNEVEGPAPTANADRLDPFGQPQQPEDTSANLPPEVKAIDAQLAAGKTLDAHRELSKLYWNRPEMRTMIAQRIDTTAQSIYFSPQPHFMDPYVVQSNDQLRLIADKYRVPWEYLVRLNRIDPKKIRPDQKLKVIKGPFSAVIDLSDFELTIHAHGYFVKKYPVGTGRDNATPIGKFTVLEKVYNPQYTDPDGKVIDADDPENPLGNRWIDLGDSYGIHGTVDPDSIGKAASRGCIRMRNPDVEEVYDTLSRGSEVLIKQ